MLVECAPAKVNLYLHVTGRRADGYHLLDSLAVFAGAHDRLTAAPADGLSLTLGGAFAPGLEAGPGNLVLRAARALGAAYGGTGGAALTLEKNLPVASGIGGGSADAAAALRLLARLWRLNVPRAGLRALAAGLGADVPVCVICRPARMSGIGEVLGAAPGLPACGLVLVNPGIGVLTPAVFAARRGAWSAAAALPAAWPDVQSMVAGLAGLANDLEAPALSLCPAVGAVLACLRASPGCLLARMSGSGATCFALTDTPASARDLAADLVRPGWWCWGGGLHQASEAA